MGRLGDVPSGRVWIDCASCKRSSRYSVASLLERFGADISATDLLRHLTASCRYQRSPGTPPARKYEHLCLAAIALPQPARQVPPVPPGVPYTIEVWKETGGSIELHLATIYPLPMAIAAFEAACLAWPTHEVTLRDRARIIQRRDRPPPSASGVPLLIASASAPSLTSARLACNVRSRPGRPARSAISVAVDGSGVRAASTRGRMSWRGRAPRGEGSPGIG